MNNFEQNKPPLSENIHSFNFTDKEIEKMQVEGKTLDDIEKKRMEVINKITRAQSTKH